MFRVAGFGASAAASAAASVPATTTSSADLNALLSEAHALVVEGEEYFRTIPLPTTPHGFTDDEASDNDDDDHEDEVESVPPPGTELPVWAASFRDTAAEFVSSENVFHDTFGKKYKDALQAMIGSLSSVKKELTSAVRRARELEGPVLPEFSLGKRGIDDSADDGGSGKCYRKYDGTSGAAAQVDDDGTRTIVLPDEQTIVFNHQLGLIRAKILDRESYYIDHVGELKGFISVQHASFAQFFSSPSGARAGFKSAFYASTAMVPFVAEAMVHSLALTVEQTVKSAWPNNGISPTYVGESDESDESDERQVIGASYHAPPELYGSCDDMCSRCQIRPTYGMRSIDAFEWQAGTPPPMCFTCIFPDIGATDGDMEASMYYKCQDLFDELFEAYVNYQMEIRRSAVCSLVLTFRRLNETSEHPLANTFDPSIVKKIMGHFAEIV